MTNQKSTRNKLNTQPLVLASTSTYRSELLARLKLPFLTAAPDVDETPLPHENALQTSRRLSLIKAQAVAMSHPDALIIGSDQIALLGDQQIGKPLTHDNAVQQLRSMRGKTITFYTAVTLFNSHTGNTQTEVAVNQVCYRDITDAQIESYLHKEKPYHCAGSIKSEGLGIAVIRSITGDDPNALIGLPLILLVDMLLNQNVEIL
jgi:septum formation protein